MNEWIIIQVILTVKKCINHISPQNLEENKKYRKYNKIWIESYKCIWLTTELFNNHYLLNK